MPRIHYQKSSHFSNLTSDDLEAAFAAIAAREARCNHGRTATEMVGHGDNVQVRIVCIYCGKAWKDEEVTSEATNPPTLPL